MNLKNNKIFKLIVLILSVIFFAITCKDSPEKKYTDYLVKGIEKNYQIKTFSDLQEIKKAIGDYLMKEGKIPEASNIKELMSILYPKYLSKPIFRDAWNEELIVISSSTHIEVISKGIDKKLNTNDDIKIGI